MEMTPLAERRVTVPGSSTGIDEFDRLTPAGLPRGRLSVLLGSAGSGKTRLGIQFLVRGLEHAAEGGVWLNFAESAGESAVTGCATPVDCEALARERLFVDQLPVHACRQRVAGAFDFEAVFARLGYAVATVKARRVFIDGIGRLFNAVGETRRCGSELWRLARYLEDLDVTTLISVCHGEGAVYRACVDEGLAEAVLCLDACGSSGHPTRELRLVRFPGMPPDLQAESSATAAFGASATGTVAA